MSEQEKISAAGELRVVSSGEMIRSAEETAEIAARIAAALDEEPEAPSGSDLSPVFKELREPKLPTLPRENRARLLMQTPNRVYFYWSLKNNPFQILHRAFGENRGSYTLVLKLINESRGTEEIHPVDAEGNWWFNVDSDSTYRAEIGFYAPNRPYFRAVYSNEITTPRKAPSYRAATDADWVVSADKFARVLDFSGFKQDAAEVAIAGDHPQANDHSVRSAFSAFIGEEETAHGFSAEELRSALFALASGTPLESLRWKIGASLFALLQANSEKLVGPDALGTLREHFGFGSDEVVEEESRSAVYGASLVHFPRSLRRRPIRDLPDLGLEKIDSVSSLRPSSSTLHRR